MIGFEYSVLLVMFFLIMCILGYFIGLVYLYKKIFHSENATRLEQIKPLVFWEYIALYIMLLFWPITTVLIGLFFVLDKFYRG